MKCPKCQQENPEDANFCNGCGNKLELACAGCGRVNPNDAKFCNGCGQRLTQNDKAEPLQRNTISQPQSPNIYTPPHLAERIIAEQASMEARGAIDGERKTITALFADIKGSMELMEDLDPEEARHIIDPALKLMMDAVHRYEGYVAQSLGDGIFALFGAPIAHEDHPQRAIYAALLMQEESRRYADRLRIEKGVPIQLRVGLNTGEVVVRSIRKDDLHTDYIPVGHSTGLAARMESLATPGSIVVSENTYRLAEGYFEFKALGSTQVKGATEPVSIYEVDGVGPLRTRLQMAARRGLVKFVGRQKEMEQMSKALEMTKRGHGQMVAALGEAGVGKSRLYYEFKLTSKRGCLVLETFSVSHGKAYPYLPLIELLENYFQINSRDDERRRREKVGGRVLMLDRTLEEALPYLFSLLGVDDPNSSLQQMDAHVRRQRTFEAIKRLLLMESLNQPLILIFEDLHWLDTETETFLNVLCESVATAQILLLVNYRPEYRHDWGSKTYYTQLRLDPLGRAEAQELLTALLGKGAELQGLKDLILEKTEGNPFFMEEIVQTLTEEDVLVGEKGDYHIDKAPTELRISPTVQGVLTARIDRLGAEEKELLQTLAVVGKEFSLSLLGKVVTQPEEEVFRLLSHLQKGEFIYEQPAFPEVEYIFKHALTQEVAYSSVLTKRRRLLHERTAQAIEELFSNLLEEHYDELAHHYSRSGNTKKAIEYLQSAGQQAVQRSAISEAISHLRTALELVKTLPDTRERIEQELTLQITMGMALQATQGFASPEVERAYNKALELAEQAGDPAKISPALQGLWQFYILRAELHRAYKLGEQLLHLANQAPELALHPVAYRAIGESLLWQGEFSRACEHFQRGIACYDSRQHRSQALLFGLEPGVVAFCFFSLSLWFTGYPDRAHKKIQEALALAQEVSHLPSTAEALNFAIIVHHLRRESQATQDRTEALITLSTEQGFPFFLAFGTMFRGWALAVQEQYKEGIKQMRQGMAAWRITGAESVWPYIQSQLAEAYGREGKAGEGLTAVAEVLNTAHKSEENWYTSEVYRLKGELLIAQEDKKRKTKDKNELLMDAEACFHKAIDIARHQNAKSWELRAIMSLSRLLKKQDKKKEAHRRLEEIYGWFTEGFDTADLKEAKVLLEELG